MTGSWHLLKVGSFTLTSNSSCLLSVRGLDSSPHGFGCVVPLPASLGFLTAWWLHSTGDLHERARQRRSEQEQVSRNHATFPGLARIPVTFLLRFSIGKSRYKDSLIFQMRWTQAPPLIGNGDGIRMWVEPFWKIQSAVTNECRPSVTIYWAPALTEL